MKKSWVLYVASRYIFKGRGHSPVLAVLGIATGVLALIVIIAVMNGFQLGSIESILEISSYHLRLESFEPEKTDELKNLLLSVKGIEAALPFKEFHALARGVRSGQQAVIARGLEENAIQADLKMKERLDFESGSFDLSSPGNALVGTELARRLGLSVGDEVTIFSVTGLLSANDDESGMDNFTVKGIFRTGYLDYDSTLVFLNINSPSFSANESDLKMGVKLSDRFADRQAVDRAEKIILQNGFDIVKITSWREYNRSFFGVLRTEKIFMFILVGLIFIVVALNIFQAQRRSVLQRREEIGLLRAVGGTQREVRLVFVLDGAIIGLTGALLGLAGGLLIASNIQGFFSLVENTVNAFLSLFGIRGNFAVFSPAVFYLNEIPSRILPLEVFIIFMFGFLSALSAAWFASRKIIRIQPAEVLRYE